MVKEIPQAVAYFGMLQENYAISRSENFTSMWSRISALAFYREGTPVVAEVAVAVGVVAAAVTEVEARMIAANSW